MFAEHFVKIADFITMAPVYRYEDVGQLWKDYAGKHEQVIEKAARTAILDTGPLIHQDQYLLEREHVQELLHEAVNLKFGRRGSFLSQFFVIFLV